MPYSPKDLNTEVLAVIAERADRGEIINRAWLVTAVIVKHPILRPNKHKPDEFSLCCRQGFVSAAVDVVLARLKFQDESGDPDQSELELPRLAGFKHLRRLYPIKRGGAVMLVPLDQMTDAEIEAKAKTYRKAQTSFGEHADELDRYRASRLLLGAA